MADEQRHWLVEFGDGMDDEAENLEEAAQEEAANTLYFAGHDENDGERNWHSSRDKAAKFATAGHAAVVSAGDHRVAEHVFLNEEA